MELFGLLSVETETFHPLKAPNTQRGKHETKQSA
jgi:hypothetical protein